MASTRGEIERKRSGREEIDLRGRGIKQWMIEAEAARVLKQEVVVVDDREEGKVRIEEKGGRSVVVGERRYQLEGLRMRVICYVESEREGKMDGGILIEFGEKKTGERLVLIHGEGEVKQCDQIGGRLVTFKVQERKRSGVWITYVEYGNVPYVRGAVMTTRLEEENIERNKRYEGEILDGMILSQTKRVLGLIKIDAKTYDTEREAYEISIKEVERIGGLRGGIEMEAWVVSSEEDWARWRQGR